eukprot:TRINITY_DN1346_c0_g1_i4.p1 TRINITY_DN1346_c0_g1~~TRINITY_DN1346_c0_g1_i4.p1  ORF type:complete len:208 (-),score=44.85 TRINITY_DN1346_c0_g1_i4:33-656(-)
MHGLGDSGAGWAPVFRAFNREMCSHIKFICPSAPSRPVTINMGMMMPAWYDIKSLDSRGAESYEGIEETQAMISSVIDAEIESGIPSERIVLGGFSQGGACSLKIGYSFDKKLAGVVGLSCYLPNPTTFESEMTPANKETELLMLHGDCDEVVLHTWGEQSFNHVKSVGAMEANFKTYSDIGHELSQEEMLDLESWILKKLPPTSSL